MACCSSFLRGWSSASSGRELAQLDQAIDQRLVARQLHEPALDEVIDAAVADVADDDVRGST